MTVTKDYTIWCDMPGCQNWEYSDEMREPSVRRQARLVFGWTHKDGRDICDRHESADSECKEARA